MPISQPVGQDGTNLRREVQYVQALLNVFRTERGRTVLALDGLVGPLTIAAIEEFQSAVTGIVDGRVDPGAQAITALEQQTAGVLDELRTITMFALLLSHRPVEEEPPVEADPVLDDAELQTLVQSIFAE
ncbi:peptidoglycan-binding domain-containing protein [Streptomyces poriticola]|uniref:peptidoglycan-binding domain-containing protein n=1 Tax=Streptomyces poriticola TaxID=3120506 RepID=UPI002FCDE4D7